MTTDGGKMDQWVGKIERLGGWKVVLHGKWILHGKWRMGKNERVGDWGNGKWKSLRVMKVEKSGK